jgi:hypothetical protein
MEVHFEEKKRVAFCGCKQTKNPPFCDGLTRGSNDVVLAANPHSECERLGGFAGGRCVSSRTTHTGAVQTKGVRCLVSMEDASVDATAC